MKFEVDTENKTITILEDVGVGELMILLEHYEKSGYTVKMKVIEKTEYIQILKTYPYYPCPSIEPPYMTYQLR